MLSTQIGIGFNKKNLLSFKKSHTSLLCSVGHPLFSLNNFAIKCGADMKEKDYLKVNSKEKKFNKEKNVND